ncbi:alpha/beta fold hydrolase [Catellatospora tritici]|uniref:alpha/beta fold hydrolase n=1 Tax=Catellatospora tritici TaxID=2851566 RepID=UPI001C2DDA4B|nr:hypothetical protein [Catellatospora tritici]MBV1854286.1 hypothetical protein [Catellatospora tritici]
MATFLRSSADGLTDAAHPAGCLSVQGGLACSPENARISEILAAGRAATESALQERLSRAAEEGDLPDGMDARALARFVMALSEGHAVHAAAGASREDLQASEGRYPKILPGTVLGYRTEACDMGAVHDRIEAAPPLRPMPVAVLSSSDLDLPDPMPAPCTAGERADVARAWRDGQDALAAGIPGAEHVTVPGTSHYVQNQRPDAVIVAVREVVTRAASARPTAS